VHEIGKIACFSIIIILITEGRGK